MPQYRKITIMLADDHNIGRQAFCSYIKDTQDNMRVIGEAANGQELLDLLVKVQPDIVLLDLEMPVLDGFKTLKIITEKYPDVKTVILSSHYNEYYVSELMFHGARGYLSKTSFSTEVFRTLNEVYSKGYSFKKGVTGHIVQTLIEDKKLEDVIGSKELTAREIEILQQICDEKQSKEIARTLKISFNTVEYHKKQLFSKTNSSSIVGLVKYAIRMGLAISVTGFYVGITIF